MKEVKNDLRVRMTKKMLRLGLTELLAKKPIQSITVAELCQKAGINRSTFYTHYTDIYNLLQTIEDEMFDEFQETLTQVNYISSPSSEQIPVFMYMVFDFVKRNFDMCAILLGENSDSRFVAKLFTFAQNKSLAEYAKVYTKSTPHEIEMFYTFIASGAIGLLKCWLGSGMKESAEEMAISANNLITGCLSFLKK